MSLIIEWGRTHMTYGDRPKTGSDDVFIVKRQYTVRDLLVGNIEFLLHT